MRNLKFDEKSAIEENMSEIYIVEENDVEKKKD